MMKKGPVPGTRAHLCWEGGFLMRVYADWDYYQGVYQGCDVAEADFARLSERASRALDGLTLGRIDGVYAKADAVRMACCAVCDVLWAAERTGGGAVAREKLDTYEVAYAQAGTVSHGKRVLEAARAYLWPTGLLSAARAGTAVPPVCPPWG